MEIFFVYRFLLLLMLGAHFYLPSISSMYIQHTIQETRAVFFNAIRKGDVEGVRCCILSGTDVSLPEQGCYNGWSPLLIATALGNLSMVKLLVEEGSADVNKACSDGYTPLHHASAEITSYLLGKGAKHNVQCERHTTPLMWAIFRQDRERVRLLLSAGSHLDLRDLHGRTARDHALVEVEEPQSREESVLARAREIVGLLVDAEWEARALKYPFGTDPRE